MEKAELIKELGKIGIEAGGKTKVELIKQLNGQAHDAMTWCKRATMAEKELEKIGREIIWVGKNDEREIPEFAVADIEMDRYQGTSTAEKININVGMGMGMGMGVVPVGTARGKHIPVNDGENPWDILDKLQFEKLKRLGVPPEYEIQPEKVAMMSHDSPYWPEESEKRVKVSDRSQPIKIVLFIAGMAYIIWRIEAILAVLKEIKALF